MTKVYVKIALFMLLRYCCSMSMDDIVDRHFTKTGAARYLDRSVRWLDYQLRGSNPPPGYKVGKCWLFKKSEIDRWLEQFRAKPDLDRIVDEVMAELGAKS